MKIECEAEKCSQSTRFLAKCVYKDTEAKNEDDNFVVDINDDIAVDEHPSDARASEDDTPHESQCSKLVHNDDNDDDDVNDVEHSRDDGGSQSDGCDIETIYDSDADMDDVADDFILGSNENAVSSYESDVGDGTTQPGDDDDESVNETPGEQSVSCVVDYNTPPIGGPTMSNGQSDDGDELTPAQIATVDV